MKDTANALIAQFTIEGAASGPLTGRTFVAKDLYDIEGQVTGCGNPDWAATHEPAGKTAPALQALLDAGATLLGKSHTDEIAYSLMGVNAHYGTPLNTAAPDRIPGGSSSGSVATVAAGMTDIGLGSDTGGSVRMPASFCGVYGIRTTHGRIDLSCAMPLAPSFDTVGWFSRDAATFAAAGMAYGMEVPDKSPVVKLLIAEDAMERTSPEGAASYSDALQKLQDLYGAASRIRLCPDLSEWLEVFKVCQAAEVWQVHKDWVTSTQPNFGPGVKERFQMAASITPEQHANASARRKDIAKRMLDLLGDDAVLLSPSSPGAAPLRNADAASLDGFRMAALELLCPAGLAGLPQVSVPAGTDQAAPLGLSLIGGRNAEETLLGMASALERA
jgi:amidase